VPPFSRELTVHQAALNALMVQDAQGRWLTVLNKLTAL
jgi:hypothetical protein